MAHSLGGPEAAISNTFFSPAWPVADFGESEEWLRVVALGDVIDNKILRRYLGEGSFGFAFEAVGTEDHKRSLVKISREGWYCTGAAAAPSPMASAVRDEIRQLVNLPRHPNLQQYLASGHHTARDGHTHVFLVSELLSGVSLRGCLPLGRSAAARVAAAGGARAILRDLAAGLAALHWQPARPGADDGEPATTIIHGRLKPENVMRSGDGAWKLVDFGSAVQARVGEGAEAHAAFTRAYISQARLMGRQGSPADDVWALGLVGLELVLGRSLLDLFPELGADEHWFPCLHLVRLGERIREAKATDSELGELVVRMLKPRPEARATAEEALVALGGSAEAVTEVVEARWRARDDDPRHRDVTGRVRDAVREGRLTVCVDSALVGEEATLAGRLEVRFRTTRGHELVARRRGGMWLDVPSRATSLATGERGVSLLVDAREGRGRVEALRGWLNRVGRDGREAAAVLRDLDLSWVAGLEGEEWNVGWRLAENVLVAGSSSSSATDVEGGSWSCAWAERVRARREEREEAKMPRLPPPANVESFDARLFAGHEDVLESLERSLDASSSASSRDAPTSAAAAALPRPAASVQAITQAVRGLGGIGKTTLAIAFCARAHAKGRYRRGIFWLNADSWDTLRASYLDVARLLNERRPRGAKPISTLDIDSAFVGVQEWMSREADWLAVFDNVDDAEAVKSLLPGRAARGHVLITTRLGEEALQESLGIAASECRRLDVLGPAEAARALWRHASGGSEGDAPPASWSEEAREALAWLAGREEGGVELVEGAGRSRTGLGGLPLALKQAGAWIRERGRVVAGGVERAVVEYRALPEMARLRGGAVWSCRAWLEKAGLGRYWPKFEEQETDLQLAKWLVAEEERLERMGVVCGDLVKFEEAAKVLPEDDGARRSVATTWGVSKQRLPEEAQRLLVAVAFLAPDGVPVAVVEGMLAELRPRGEEEAVSRGGASESKGTEEELEGVERVDLAAEARRIVLEWERFSLVTVTRMDEKPVSVSLHRLLQTVLREQVEPEWSGDGARLVRALRDCRPPLIETFECVQDGLEAHERWVSHWVEVARWTDAEMAAPSGFRSVSREDRVKAMVPVRETLATHLWQSRQQMDAFVTGTLQWCLRSRRDWLWEEPHEFLAGHFDACEVLEAVAEFVKDRDAGLWRSLLEAVGEYRWDSMPEEAERTMAVMEATTSSEGSVEETLNTRTRGLEFVSIDTSFRLVSVSSRVHLLHLASRSRMRSLAASDGGRYCSLDRAGGPTATVDRDQAVLRWASFHGRMDVVDRLVSAGVEVSAKDSRGRTALHWASAKGHLAVVTRLVSAGADIEAADKSESYAGQAGRTALHLASAGGHLAVVHCLVSAGADVSAADEWGRTSLFFASKYGHSNVVDRLVSAGVDVSAADLGAWTALHAASKRGHLGAVDRLVSAGADVSAKDEEGRTALHWASAGGHLSVVNRLVSAGTDVSAEDEKGWIALHLASLGGHLAVVDRLLSAGADVSKVNTPSPFDVEPARTALHWASKEGHVDVVDRLLSAGADLGSMDSAGWTALHVASASGHLAVVHCLLSAGADVSAVDFHDRTALHSASEEGQLLVVDRLVSAGANLEAMDSRGRTALHWAGAGGHLAVVDRLLSAGADVFAVDSGRWTALHLASVGDHLAVVDRLLSAGADVSAGANVLVANASLLFDAQAAWKALHWASEYDFDDTFDSPVSVADWEGWTPLHMASARGHVAVADRLVSAGPAVLSAADSEGRTALHLASKHGHLGVVDLLVSVGADISALDARGRTALCYAIAGGHFDVVDRVMLAWAAALPEGHVESWTALHEASAEGHLSVVDRLVSAGADPTTADKQGRTALHWASAGGHLDVVNRLILAGGDVSASDSRGQTALLAASKGGHLWVVDRLVSAGADVSAADEEGRAPLHWASAGGHLWVVDRLVSAGADLSAADKDERTALHWASAGDHVAVVDRLLLAGVDVDLSAEDQWGRTALHWASAGGHLWVVARLLSAGADVSAKDKEGRTALHWASVGGHLWVVDRLLSAGAEYDHPAPLLSLAGHTNQVVSLLAHPCLPILFSGSADHTVRVWDLETRSLLHTLAGHTWNVLGLALDPAGRRLASGSGDNTVRLWDLDSGACLRTLAGHSSAVIAVAWEAAGSLVASGSDDNTVRLWHADSGALRHTLEGHSSYVYALAAHPADDLLASGSGDRTVRVWRWSSGAHVRTLAGHEGSVCSLAASAAWLVSGSFDKSVRVWSWASGACVRVLDGFAGRLDVNSLAWRDSTLVALTKGGRDSWNEDVRTMVFVWDASSADPGAWLCVGSLASKASSHNGVAALDGSQIACTAPGDWTRIAVWGV